MKHSLLSLWHALVAFFLMPGEAMLRSLAHTSWGHDWLKGGGEDWPLAIGFAILFWCILLSLLGAMDDRVRGFLYRGNRRRRRDDD